MTNVISHRRHLAFCANVRKVSTLYSHKKARRSFDDPPPGIGKSNRVGIGTNNDVILDLTRGADLHVARLGDSDLTGTNLLGAPQSSASLFEAKITKGQLDKAYSLYHAEMPDGSIHP